MLSTLASINKLTKQSDNQEPATITENPYKTSNLKTPAQLTGLWLLGFIPYAFWIILLFAFFPEMWLWELVLHTYDFIGDPAWDYIYESFIAFLALAINMGLIYLTALLKALKTNNSPTRENT